MASNKLSSESAQTRASFPEKRRRLLSPLPDWLLFVSHQSESRNSNSARQLFIFNVYVRVFDEYGSNPVIPIP